MTQQSEKPSWLNRFTKRSRRDEAVETHVADGHSADLARLREPLWDPVVEIADPWRRNSEPTAEEIAEWMPRFVWPETTIADTLFTGGRGPAERPEGQFNDGVGTTVPPATLTSELATLLSAASTMAHEATDDVRLTRQLLATARAMNLVTAREPVETVFVANLPEAEVPSLSASESEAPVADEQTAEAAVTSDVAVESNVDAVPVAEASPASDDFAPATFQPTETETANTASREVAELDAPSEASTGSDIAALVVEEEISAVADVDSMALAGSALAAATAEITAMAELLSSVMPSEAAANAANIDAIESSPFADSMGLASGFEQANEPIGDPLPVMASRLEWTADRSGFDTVRPPVRAAADEEWTSSEAHLDRSSDSTETSLDTATETPAATDVVSAMPEATTSIAESVELQSDEASSSEAVGSSDGKTPIDVESLPADPVTEPDVHIVDSRIDEVANPGVEVEQPTSENLIETLTESVAEVFAEAEKPPVAVAVKEAVKTTASTVLAPAVRDEYNRTNVDFRRPWPRPKVRGLVIDFHCHLLARRHAEDWFEAADHYGMDVFVTMSPLEEAVTLARDWGQRLRFIAVPKWGDESTSWVDNWLNRIEAFYNLGSRIAKFHAAPGTMAMRGHRLDSPAYKPLFAEVKARGMAIMTHIGDPDTWYHGRYDPAKFGTREEHYAMWEALLEEHRGHTWIGAHMGGNPEDLPRLQRLLDRFPDLWLDCSATRWMIREISARREPAREFFIRNADRILFGSDQVSGDDRHFDFLASRIWCHRKLWETAYIGPSPIIDPDVPDDQQPTVRGLALPDVVLQKIYHDNATRLLAKLGMGF